MHRGDIHANRKDGLRRASVRDFHSYRVTWVTLALTAGVPLELVQKVTEHKTTDIVSKHYCQPGREDFRHALQSAMPKLLTNGHKSPQDKMREVIEKLTARNVKTSKARLPNAAGEILNGSARLKAPDVTVCGSLGSEHAAQGNCLPSGD